MKIKLPFMKRNAAETAAASPASGLALWLRDGEICCEGYTRLSDNPEIQTACLRIAELIGSMTIHLMENTEDGDVRIIDGLSRTLDIQPNRNQGRTDWMIANVMNLLLFGHGNAICVPHTHSDSGTQYLESLEPIAAERVQLQPVGGSYRDYRVLIDGVARKPENLLHFAYNPDPTYLWKGRGVTVTLRDIAQNLKQAQKTENAFMTSEWKPSIIVKVDALTEEFASPEGRQKLLDSYIEPARTGAPWLIPADQFQVEQVRPLTLSDLAIKDTVELDKKTVAAVVGVPAYLLGVGDFNRDEWNNFIQTKIRTIALIIQQELTRCLIYSERRYIVLNYWSLLDYDLKSTSDILLAGADRGYINGDEWRDRMHFAPAGLKEYKILENYIPADMSGLQKKLVQDGGA